MPGIRTAMMSDEERQAHAADQRRMKVANAVTTRMDKLVEDMLIVGDMVNKNPDYEKSEHARSVGKRYRAAIKTEAGAAALNAAQQRAELRMNDPGRQSAAAPQEAATPEPAPTPEPPPLEGEYIGAGEDAAPSAPPGDFAGGPEPDADGGGAGDFDPPPSTGESPRTLSNALVPSSGPTSNSSQGQPSMGQGFANGAKGLYSKAADWGAKNQGQAAGLGALGLGGAALGMMGDDEPNYMSGPPNIGGGALRMGRAKDGTPVMMTQRGTAVRPDQIGEEQFLQIAQLAQQGPKGQAAAAAAIDNYAASEDRWDTAGDVATGAAGLLGTAAAAATPWGRAAMRGAANTAARGANAFRGIRDAVGAGGGSASIAERMAGGTAGWRKPPSLGDLGLG